MFRGNLVLDSRIGPWREADSSGLMSCSVCLAGNQAYLCLYRFSASERPCHFSGNGSRALVRICTLVYISLVMTQTEAAP